MNKPVLHIIIFTILFVRLGLAQQNLIPNGSFEKLSDCPVGADIEKAIGWFSASEGTPDLFNACAPQISNLSVPSNSFGYQYAEDGNGYAGIVCYGEGYDYREYIGIRLSETMEQGVLYVVSFYINLPETSPKAVNNVSVGFFFDSAYFATYTLVYPDCIMPNNAIIADSLEWTKFTFYYNAVGKENYLVIGNFKPDNQTQILSIQNTNSDQYYFIDEVSVLKFAEAFENVLTPNDDGINDYAFLNPSIDFLDIVILNRWGETVKETDFQSGWNGTDSKGNMLNEGVYFYRLRSKSPDITFEKTGFIHLVR